MKEKQRAKILEYLKKHGSITQLEALQEIGCMRLATRIWELKNWDGYVIRTDTEYYTNSQGERKHYARYVLIQDEKEELTCTCDTDKLKGVSKIK